MTDTLEYKPNLADTVRRMERFWNMKEPEDRIPVIVHIPGGSRPGLDGYFFGKPAEYADYAEQAMERRLAIADDYIPQVTPPYGHAIISALIGASIVAEAETVWSVPFLSDLFSANELRLNWDNIWGERFRADCEYLLGRACGKYAVGVYEIEGVGDTLSALFGAENIFADFYEHSAAARAFAARVTDLLIEFGRWGNEHVGERQNICGGIVTDYGMWMPRGSCCTAEDATVMCSREYYREFLKEHTGRLARSFTKILIEVHKEGNRHIAEFGRTEGIDAMTVENFMDMDDSHRADMKELLGSVNFCIYAQPEHIEQILAFTGTRGVMIMTGAPTVSEANEILAETKRLTRKFRKGA